MTTTLEKAARAIHEELRNPGEEFFDRLTASEQDDWCNIARAALEAIRVPSAVVAYEATGGGWNHVEGGFDALWRSAIDAILNEKTT